MPPKTQRLKQPKANCKCAVTKIPAPTEAQIQDAIMNRLQMDKWLVIRFNGGAFKDSYGNYVRSYIIQGIKASAGVPDVIAFKNDRFLMVEVKDHKGKLTPSQERFKSWAKKFGVTVHVLRHWNEVEPLLREVQP